MTTVGPGAAVHHPAARAYAQPRPAASGPAAGDRV